MQAIRVVGRMDHPCSDGGRTGARDRRTRRRRRRLISTTHRIRCFVADERARETHLMKLQTNQRESVGPTDTM